MLPGTEAKYRELADGEIETPAGYLPHGATVFYRGPAGVDGAIMLNWINSYMEETADLWRSVKTLVVRDGYASPLSLHLLTRLVENNVLIHVLPSHSSHNTQLLDVAVFGPMKGANKSRVSSYVNNPANARAKFTIFTACELIASAYSAALTQANIKIGLQRTGIFPVKFAFFNDDSVAISSPYAAEGDPDVSDPWEDVHRRLFLRGKSLANSVNVNKTGTTSTTSGCHVTSEAVMAVVWALVAKRAEDAKNKSDAEAAAAHRKTAKVAATAAAAAKKTDRAVATSEAAKNRAAEQTKRKAAQVATVDRREAVEVAKMRAVAGARAAARQAARPVHVRVATAKRRTLQRRQPEDVVRFSSLCFRDRFWLLLTSFSRPHSRLPQHCCQRHVVRCCTKELGVGSAEVWGDLVNAARKQKNRRRATGRELRVGDKPERHDCCSLKLSFQRIGVTETYSRRPRAQYRPPKQHDAEEKSSCLPRA